jgi:hypothetical protein
MEYQKCSSWIPTQQYYGQRRVQLQVTTRQAAQPKNSGLIPDTGRRLFLFWKVPRPAVGPRQAYYSMRTWALFLLTKSQVVNLATYPHLVFRLSMIGLAPSFPLWLHGMLLVSINLYLTHKEGNNRQKEGETHHLNQFDFAQVTKSLLQYAFPIYTNTV